MYVYKNNDVQHFKEYFVNTCFFAAEVQQLGSRSHGKAQRKMAEEGRRLRESNYSHSHLT